MVSSIDIKFSNFFHLGYNFVRWHFNYYIRKKPFPLIAQFYSTNRCNFKCDMCNFWRNKNKNEIPLEKFKEIIDDLKKMGCCFVNFTGGEPLLLKDIIERIEYVKKIKNIPYMHMVSNGYLLDKEMAKKLNNARIDGISISINAIGENNDKITKVKGSFDKSINAIKNLKEYAPKIHVSINSMITPWNIKELYELLDLSEKLKVDYKFQAISNHPLFEKRKVNMEGKKFDKVPIEEVKEFINVIKKKKYILNSKYYLSQIPNYFLSENKDGLFSEKCLTPYYFCEFKENGEFSPCLTGTRWNTKHSIYKNRLKNILKSEDYKVLQKDLEKCRICQENMQVCIIEPRVIFPIRNFLRYTL